MTDDATTGVFYADGYLVEQTDNAATEPDEYDPADVIPSDPETGVTADE